MEASARHLALRASIVLLIGLLCGIRYGRSILRSAGSNIVYAWHVAQLSLPSGAMPMRREDYVAIRLRHAHGNRT